MYESSIVPKHMPGGGGFSVLRFSLSTLYDMHLHCHNWWTQSNDNLPLCRFSGAKLKLYRSEHIDYVLRYNNNFPMTSTKLTYPSCQPSMLMMMNNSVIISSLKNTKSKKPYKIVKIRPPAQLETKWYFQRDLNDIPLFLLHVAPCSLNHYYISPWSESNNITIRHLNTRFFQNRQFKPIASTGYYYKPYGTTNLWLYATLINYETAEYQHLIPLANTETFTKGKTFTQTSGETWGQYTKTKANWGNPFHPEYLLGDYHLYSSTYSPTTLGAQQQNKKIKDSGDVFTKVEEPLVLETRYNPNRDTGVHNSIFLLKTNKPETGWDPPAEESVILEHFPLWLGIFGYIDYQKKQATYSSIDTTTVLCIKTDTTMPKYDHTIVPLDYSFEQGHTPYAGENLLEDDRDKWYPQVQYQPVSINDITKTGPGIVKLENKLSEEIKCEYELYFKWGGNPAKMVTIDNPGHQPIYPMPRTNIETPSLQNPASPPEYYLYSFDQRQDFITKKAAERIKTDWTITEPLFSITGSTRDVPVHQTFKTQDQETSDSEKEEETLLLQLQQQQLQQQQLKHRIRQLILRTQNLE